MAGQVVAQIWRWLALVLALAASPAISSQVPRIVAIGDLHGDHAVWRAIAGQAGLIDAGGRWIGGTTVLVQTGDIPDRGDDSLKIITEIQQLQREARQSGGRVVALVGNHEAMNVTGDLRYVNAGEYAAFVDSRSEQRREDVFVARRRDIEAAYRRDKPDRKAAEIREAWFAATPLGMIEHQQAWRPAGRIGKWVVGNPAVVRLGDTLFVHAGIGPTYANMSVDAINRAVAAALRARDTSEHAIINAADGPLWYRGLVRKEDHDPMSLDAEIERLRKRFGVARIVIGHTPLLSGVAIHHGGRLVRVDSGNAAYYGGQPGYLEILNGKAIAHAVPRPLPAGS